MECPSCGAANREGAKFCASCGTPLGLACPSCGAPYEPGQGFCDECGTALTAAPAPARAVVQPAAERRLVSVLFADLVGFTTASEGRDSEETRELLSRYFETARTLIERYGGTVEKFIGDAVMAVWGTPVAQEDDAERAVRTALDLVAAVPELDPGLRARAGVLTGEAAVTLGAAGPGHGRGRPRQHGVQDPVGRRAGHGARRRGDETRDRGGRGLRGRRRARARRARRRACPCGARSASPPRAAARSGRSAWSRPSSAATASCGSSRRSSTPPPRSAAPS